MNSLEFQMTTKRFTGEGDVVKIAMKMVTQ